MKGIVLLSSMEKPFDEKLAEVFVRENYTVYAMASNAPLNVRKLSSDPLTAAKELGEDSGRLDFLLDTTDISDPEDRFTIRDGINFSLTEEVFKKNVVFSMSVLEAFLPLLEQGYGKRLFYLSSINASINHTKSQDHFAYNMSKAALHQFIQMTRNKLLGKGYSYRIFDPLYSEIDPSLAAEAAFNYISRRRGIEGPQRDDEDNIVLRDAYGRLHSW